MFEKIFVVLETRPAGHEIISCLCGLRSLGAREARLAYFLSVNKAFAAAFVVASVVSSAGEIKPLVQISDGAPRCGLIKEVFLGSVSHIMARHGKAHLLLVPLIR